jgi:hypothetical protein
MSQYDLVSTFVLAVLEHQHRGASQFQRNRFVIDHYSSIMLWAVFGKPPRHALFRPSPMW